MTNNEFIEQFKDCYETDVEFRKFLWGELLDNLRADATDRDGHTCDVDFWVGQDVFKDTPKKP